ncbi:MAG TPA: hypothetical protein VLG49_04225 [Rhabdochlamydiaceae bacterium]|nr:hypothetical protein [Rhabdochlamydiaceae bacterium]
MKINEVMTNGCHNVQTVASNAGSWMHKTVSRMGTHLANFATKAADVVRPHFNSMRDFMNANKQLLIVGAVAATTGAILAAVVTLLVHNRRASQAPQHA